MIILKVIHGYPPRFNAGSEVYSQTLCHELAGRHTIHVFTRYEDSFKESYACHTEQDPLDPRITLHLINLPRERFPTQYRHRVVDDLFGELLRHLKPDLVHIGHLNHLSTSLVHRAYEHQCPIVFTLHDYWLMCPRGQFIQRNSTKPYALCEGQEDRKCATSCYQGFSSGDSLAEEAELSYWTGWINQRMVHMREVAKLVDHFIAPSHYLLDRFTKDFGLPKNKITYLDYGFDMNRLQNRTRASGLEPFTFGYIGTHIPAKGIQDLIKAFAQVKVTCALKIWGREMAETKDLKSLVSTLPLEKQRLIKWQGEYTNQAIVKEVFNHIDSLVVPSIWVENSPLVIHEALQVRLPVITAAMGGMAEYMQHGVNGFLYAPRDVNNLATQMERVASDPNGARRVAQEGYVAHPQGDIPSINEHAQALEVLFEKLIAQKKPPPHLKEAVLKPGPWRITFDTNPDQCNFKCIMCECFSPYSKVKEERLAKGIPKRRMDIHLIRQVLEQAKGSPLREIIPSTMGEPLLYPEFEEIISLCQKHHIKLNLTTNGSFPRKSAREWASLLVPLTSDIKISWNGATKETHEKIMLGAQWEKNIENLKTFIEIRDEHACAGGHRCRVTLQLTFLETNVHELSDIVKLGISMGVDRIKGHHLWAHFKEIKDLSMRRSPEAIEQWNKAVQEAKKIARTSPLPNGNFILLENIEELELNAVKDLKPDGVCPFLGEEAWVNTEGRFSPCCAPDTLRRELGDFGNLYETTLEKIWTGEDYNHLKRTYRSHPLCVGCNMKKPALFKREAI